MTGPRPNRYKYYRSPRKILSLSKRLRTYSKKMVWPKGHKVPKIILPKIRIASAKFNKIVPAQNTEHLTRNNQVFPSKSVQNNDWPKNQNRYQATAKSLLRASLSLYDFVHLRVFTNCVSFLFFFSILSLCSCLYNLLHLAVLSWDLTLCSFYLFILFCDT